MADLAAEGTEPSLDIIKTLAPEQAERKQIILEGDSEESVAKFFENIRREL
jgi:electron transfer flavoprotein beta subunit